MIYSGNTQLGPGKNGECLCGVDGPNGWAELIVGITVGYQYSVAEIIMGAQTLKWTTATGLCGSNAYMTPRDNNLGWVTIKVGEFWRDGGWTSSIDITVRGGSVTSAARMSVSPLYRANWYPPTSGYILVADGSIDYGAVGTIPNWAACGSANNCCNIGSTSRTYTYYDDGSATFT